MRRALYQIIPWTIILLPFLILGVSYSSLPAEIMAFRGFDAASAEYAPKSLFTVFRVPLIEVRGSLRELVLDLALSPVSRPGLYAVIGYADCCGVSSRTLLSC